MPGKAARLDLEGDDDLLFEFFLADKLGMTVARLRREMGHGEFVYWSRYHQMVADRQEVAGA